jgi:tetratricopeptide (TPR) repeat protein
MPPSSAPLPGSPLPGRKTGAVPRPAGRSTRTRLPASATKRVPAATGTRTTRTATGATQTAGAAAPRGSRPQAIYIGAGAAVALLLLILVATGGGGGPRRPNDDAARKRYDEATELFNQRQYPEADNVLHALLAKTSLSKSDSYRRAEAFHAELHPLAEIERGARREVTPWLDRAGRFLASATSVDEGAALYEEGRRLAERYTRSTFKDEMDAKMLDLGRYKGQKQSDEAFARYQEVAEQAKALRQQKDFGGALRLWEGLKGAAGLDPIAASKIGSRLLEIQNEAIRHVEELGRQAEGLRKEGKPDDARRLLETARPGLKGTGALPALESLLKR